MNSLEVCLSPRLAHLFSFEHKTAVIIDIFRATSCFVTGIANGIRSIRTVSTIDECKIWQDKGYVGAAERGGMKVEGFSLGNSPFEYTDKALAGKRVVATTTNGTLAVAKSEKAKSTILASFLNISAVAAYLRENHEDAILICAGWEGQVNLEDTVFAGALIDKLVSSHQPVGDPSSLSLISYYTSKHKLNDLLSAGEHAQRLLNLNLRKDIDFCLQWDLCDLVPVLKKGEFSL